MLELCFKFFDKYCDVIKFEEPEMDTDLLYLGFFEEALCDCIRPAMKKRWKSPQSVDCTGEFPANSTTIFFPVLAA